MAQVKTHQIATALRRRLKPEAWALFYEVGVESGSTRRADAVAMCTWRSRHYEIHGYEFKVSRGDWLKELASPEKAEEVMRFCDRWWICAPKGLVAKAELPHNWGLLELRGESLFCVKQAPYLEQRAFPESFGISSDIRGFFAMVLRRAAGDDAARIAEAVRIATNELRAKHAEQLEDAKRNAAMKAGDFKERYEALLEALGGLDTWTANPEVVKRAVAAVTRLNPGGTYTALTHLRQQLQGAIKALDSAVKELGPPDATDDPVA